MFDRKSLDVGCGLAKRPGTIGVDQVALPCVDVVCDLNDSWPFEDDSFDHVMFRHSICHLQSLEAALREARRVCRVGGQIEIITPHFSSDNAFTDPTMNFSTGYRTIDYYCENASTVYKYYGQFGLKMKYRRIHIYRVELINWRHRIVAVMFWPLEVLINTVPRFYEKFLCFLVRGNEVHFVLEACD